MATSNRAVYESWCKLHLHAFTQGEGKWASARCPQHDDKKPSLSVDLESGGFKCNSSACRQPTGNLRELAQNANLPTEGLPAQRKTSDLEQQAEYRYPKADGTPWGLVRRYWNHATASKDFRQFHFQGTEEKAGAGGRKFPLYRAPELLRTEAGSLVLFLEGEKAVAAAVKLGFEATTTAAGAGRFTAKGERTSAQLSDACDPASIQLLADHHLVVLPDNDSAGRNYALAVGEGLIDLAASVKVLELPGLHAKGDLVNWVQAGGTADELRSLIASASTWEDWQSSPTKADAPPTEPDEAWEPLVPFNEETRPAFPLDALPASLAAYVQAVSTTMQVPLDLPALYVLGLLASAVQKKVDFEIGADQVFSLNLWTLVVYPSGGGKSRAMTEIQAPLVRFEQELQDKVTRQNDALEEEKAGLQARLDELNRKKGRTSEEDQEMAGLRARVREAEPPALPELFTSESTSEALEQKLIANDGRLAVWNAEGGDLFEILGGRYSASGSSNLGIWLKGFSQESGRTGRVLRGTNWIHKPTLSLSLAVQPVVFESIIRRADFEKRGLTARFLIAVPPSWLGFRDIDPPSIPGQTRGQFQNLARKLLSIQASKDENGRLVPHRLEPTLAARKAILKFAQWAEKQLQSEGSLSEVREFGARVKEHLVKVAGLLHCAQHPDEPWETHVSEETIERAARIVRWSAEHVRLALGSSTGSERIGRAEYLLEKITTNPGWKTGFRVRDLWQVVKQKRCYPDLAPLSADLEFLAEREYIREVTAATGKRGRPSKTYLVSPLVSPFVHTQKASPISPIIANVDLVRVISETAHIPNNPQYPQKYPDRQSEMDAARNEIEGLFV